MTTLREAAQQALDFCEFLWREVAMNDYAEEQREATEAALRAALAEQAQPVAWAPMWAVDRLTGKLGGKADPVTWGLHAPLYARLPRHDAVALYTTPPAPQPLTIEKLRDALVASRVIDPGAVEDPDNYDDGVTLHRIEALYRRIT